MADPPEDELRDPDELEPDSPKPFDPDDDSTWPDRPGWFFDEQAREQLDEHHTRREHSRRHPGDRDPSARRPRGAGTTEEVDLEVWDAGLDNAPIPPREWLLGTTFCRGFISSLLGDGATGKTAFRIACALALATGRTDIIDEKVFQRCRVLYLSFEDGRDETRRRIRAAQIYHGISNQDIEGWLFVAAITRADLKIATQARNGQLIPGALPAALEKEIDRLGIDVVILDPFVKTHGVNENDNNALDGVMDRLGGLAINKQIAIDVPHHTRKGAGEPGDADVGRGASAAKNAGRLVYTLTKMSPKEAEELGISRDEARYLIRHDSAKVNIAPPSDVAKWFKLVGVKLNNPSELYPNGDSVQTVEPWEATDMWRGLPALQLNVVIDELAAGIPNGGIGVQRYFTDHGSASHARSAWIIVKNHFPHLSDGQAKRVIAAWVKSGLLYPVTYQRKGSPEHGLQVDHTKRPTI